MNIRQLAVILFTLLNACQAEPEGQELYKKALSLLQTLRARSVSLTIPPSSSLFSAASYTPLLDLIEAQGHGPLVSAVKLTRRVLGTSQRDEILTAEQEEQRLNNAWSLNGLLNRFTGSNRLLGDIGKTHESTESRTRKILDGLAAGAALSRAELRIGMKQVQEMFEKAGELGEFEAYRQLGDLSFWGKYGSEQNMSRALEAYKKLADTTGSPEAQYMIGFMQASGLSNNLKSEGDQASAMLYYTFAALGGSVPAEMTCGYRHWVGIATKQSCADALPFYKAAADKAMAKFNAGPPGGAHLPPAKVRLSDAEGGVFGPGASVASTGINARNSPHGHHHHSHTPTSQQEWDDVLEFYNFHADRGSADFMFRLGRIYYQGFGSLGAIRKRSVLSREGAPELGGRDFARALKWFHRIARAVWPRDPQSAIRRPLSAGVAIIGSYDASKDAKVPKDEHLTMVAALSAGFLGKMYLRGEGVPQDFVKAFLWFSRGATNGDHQSMNGLGVMYRDGLGVTADQTKALTYFQSASAENLAEAQVNLGKFYLNNGDLNVASQYLELAIRNGDAFQAFYYLAELNAHAVGRPDLCPVAVAFYKIVAERGDWDHETWWESERAWARGEKQKALLGYWLMAERGYEVAQNNVAYILDRDKSTLKLPPILAALIAPSDRIASTNVTDRLALAYWTRSAAQDNIDALVKMGDYYLKGIGLPNPLPQPAKAAACYQSAASTHVSALAMHNLGWMHELGIGVKQDFHLAKRYYDLALETNSEAYLPVFLSLLKLHARSVYHAVKGGDMKSITVQSPFATRQSGPTGTESEEAASERSNGPTLESAFQHLIHFRFHQAVAEFHGFLSAKELETKLQSQNPPATEATMQDAQRALSSEDDPIRWAREQQERENLRGEEEEEDYLDSFGRSSESDVLESVAIIALCLAIAWLFWYRQARIDAGRAQAG